MQVKEETMRTTIMMSVKPIILGTSAEALKTAFSLFRRYSLSSCVFDIKVPFIYRFIAFISQRKISSSDDRFITMSLDHYIREYGESTYLLIPCTEEHIRFVERNRDALENKFLIRSPEQILGQGELFPTAAKGKDV